MNPQARSIVVFLVIGLLAGWLAGLIIGGGGGLLRNLIVGVIGAFVGGYLFGMFNINLGIRNEFVRQVVTATAGAILVVLLARLVA